MNHVVLLRVLLMLAVLLSIIAGSIDALLPQAIPEAGREAFHSLQASRNAATGPLFVGLAAAYEIIVLAAVVGMFRLRRWGLHLGIVATVLTLLQAYWLGPHAYSGLAFMVSYAGKVAWGAALGLASMVTSASTVNAARTATPATG